MSTDTYCGNEMKIRKPTYYQPKFRMYLSVANDVYVDNAQMILHQKNGIRFLYQQYNQFNPGVIVNDPPGYGKRLQIVLFIGAIKHLLTKPVMIFCSKDELKNWVEHFQMWTNFSNEIVVNSSNPFIKKAVFINSMCTWSTVTRGNWSVFVVDIADIVPKSLEAIKAIYKIWVTNENMRTNLEKFEQIYKWINPKESKFDLQEFTKECKDMNITTWATILECFQKKILFRRVNFKGPLFKKQKANSHTKDVTGTKIKRSRTKVNETNEPPAKVTRNIEKSNAIETRNEEINIISDENDVETEVGEMDIEKFIRDQKPISCHDLQINSPESEDTLNMNCITTYDQRKPKDLNDKRSHNINLENNEHDKANFKNSTVDELCVEISDVKNEITELNEIKSIYINIDQIMEKEQETAVKKTIEIQSEDNVTPNKIKFGNQCDSIIESEGVKSEIKEEKKELENNDHDEFNLKNITVDEPCNNSVDISNAKNQITELSETRSTENMDIEIKIEEQEISDYDTFKNNFEIKSETNTQNNIKSTNESDSVIKSEGVKSVINEEKNINKVDVDSELNYLNEKLLKKFKGSLLDKLFK